MAVSFFGVYASEYDYPYLVFTETGGTKVSVAVTDLVMTVSGGQLVASNASGTQIFSLEQLKSMEFSTTGTVGVSDPISENLPLEQDGIEVFDLQGRRLGRLVNLSSGFNPRMMKKGIYVVRNAQGKTSKITVR